MTPAENIRKDILLEGLDDEIGLDFILGSICGYLKPKNKNEKYRLSLNLIEAFLKEEIITINEELRQNDNDWNGSVSAIMKKINKEWGAFGQDPEGNWEIVSFDLTPKGEEEAKKILDYYREVGSPGPAYKENLSLWDKKKDRDISFDKNGRTSSFTVEGGFYKWVDVDVSSYKWDKKRSLWLRVDENGKIWHWSDGEEDWVEDKDFDEKPQWDEIKKKWFFPSTIELQKKAKNIDSRHMKMGYVDEDEIVEIWNAENKSWVDLHKNGDTTIFEDSEDKFIPFNAEEYKWNKKRNVWQRVDEKGKLWSWSKEEEDWIEDDIVDEKSQWDEKQKKWFFPSTRKLQQRRRSLLGKLDRKIKTKLDNLWGM